MERQAAAMREGMRIQKTGFETARMSALSDGIFAVALTLLMCVSLIPWSAALLGTYHHDPMAVVLFPRIMGLVGLVMLAQWLYAFGSAGLTTPEIHANTRLLITLLLVRLPCISLLSISLAFVNRTAALWSWLLLILVGVAMRERYARTYATFLDAASLSPPDQESLPPVGVTIT
jgi:uncharacterized membrane protein